MARLPVKAVVFAAVAAPLVLILVGIGYWMHVRDRAMRADRRYPTSAGSLEEWKSYGGAWEILAGAIHNNSSERGSKLVTGSTRWTDYTLQVDLHFDGNLGDMGVIIRSNDEEEGVDAYRGYYAGLRTTDDSLVIGRADYGWIEAKPVPMPGGLHEGPWYRLTVTSYQCFIAAESRNLTTQQAAWVVFEEHPCIRSGRIGLRSVSTGGSWRNISIVPANNENYQNIRRHVSSTVQPEFPRREADYNLLSPLVPQSARTPWTLADAPSPPPVNTHIGDLLNLSRTSQKDVALRGVVTLTNPDLYIQDSTGGVLVKPTIIQRLNVGDVVEVRGRLQSGLYSLSIQSDSIRLLWNGTPAPPISVTPAQAASGAYDARFIEIEGRLTKDETVEGGTQVLSLTDGIQSFRTMNAHRLDESPRKIQMNSYLRVRGICVLNQAYTRDLAPFVILLPSGDDIQVLAGPPWWNPWHESLLFTGVLIVVLLIQVAYFRFQRWKAGAITRERERLAHEIHDTMAQGFAGVGYQIQGVHKMVVASDHIDRRQVSEQLRLAHQLVRRCHEEASRTIAMLGHASPPTQDNLLTTLADAARRISGEQIRTITQIEGTSASLSLRTANALLLIGREAVVNAAAHATPTEIIITLHFGEDFVELIVADNGHGFDFSQEKAGFGILGMQKCARDIAGVFEIQSTPTMGTEVRIRTSLHNESILRRTKKALVAYIASHS